jgi:hypothetical protein
MALARIITRSQACSRELALDLLARGYAVEIVSPDAIPDNLADLELRVEEDPGNQLVANVATHNGERSASLDFVHYLKTPMPDFVRRPLEPQDAAQVSEQPFSFNAERNAEAVEQPVEASQAPSQNVIAAAEPLLNFESAEPSISLPAQTASSTVEIPGYFPVEELMIASAPVDDLPVTHSTTAASASLLSRLSAHGVRSAGWRWRAALTFASVVSLALVLAFGLRRSGNDNAQSAAAVPDDRVAAATSSANLLSPSDAMARAEQVPPTVRPVLKEARPPVAVSKAASSSKAVAAKKVSRRHEDDLVARDTVTYLDKGFAPRAVARSSSKTNPPKQVAHKHSRRRTHHDEVIAANKVTYLNPPAAKKAK